MDEILASAYGRGGSGGSSVEEHRVERLDSRYGPVEDRSAGVRLPSATAATLRDSAAPRNAGRDASKTGYFGRDDASVQGRSLP